MPLALTNSLTRRNETFVPVTWFGEHLSPHWANSLSLLLARIRARAMAHVSENHAGGSA